MTGSGAKILCAMVVAAVISVPAIAGEQGSFQKTFQVSGPVELEAYTRSGDITVHAGNSGTVLVSGKIHVGDHWLSSRQDDVNAIQNNPPLQQNGNHIKVDYVNYRNISIDYDITVPAETRVTAHSGSGNETLDGLRGSFNLETGSGDLKLNNLTGEMNVHTGSGNVHSSNVAGPVDAESGSGDIRLDEKAQGDVHVRTGSGNLEIRGVNGGLRVQTGSGDVTVDGTQAGEWDLRAGSGNITIRLPQTAAFDIDASTSSGSLDITPPVTMTIQGSTEHLRKNVRGKVRGGGPELIVRTGSGDIRID